MALHNLSGPDNATFAFHGREGISRCGMCGGSLNKMADPLAGVKIRRRKYDVSYTYDGLCIVSKRFKDVWESNGLTGAEFKALPDDQGYYALWSQNIVEYDPDAAGAQFEERCNACGRHKGVTCGRICLKAGSFVPDRGLAQTDLWFADVYNDGMNPILLCGDGAKNVLCETNLKGLYFTDEEPPVTIPEAIWNKALPTLKETSRGEKQLPPRIFLRLRSGSVIGDVEVNWRREVLQEGIPADPDHTPEYDFDAEMDQEWLEYETDDIVGVGVTLRSFLGLKKKVIWFNAAD